MDASDLQVVPTWEVDYFASRGDNIVRPIFSGVAAEVAGACFHPLAQGLVASSFVEKPFVKVATACATSSRRHFELLMIPPSRWE